MEINETENKKKSIYKINENRAGCLINQSNNQTDPEKWEMAQITDTGMRTAAALQFYGHL